MLNDRPDKCSSCDYFIPNSLRNCTLFLDLYDQTREPVYLTQARRYAQLAIERLYWNGLFRGATGINHYESQLLVANLIYGLVWLHAVEKDPTATVAPNYFNR